MKFKEQIRNYHVALLTVFCLIMGNFSFLFYCSLENGILYYFLINIMIISLVGFMYKKVIRRFDKEGWQDSVVFTGVLLPYILGNVLSRMIMIST